MTRPAQSAQGAPRSWLARAFELHQAGRLDEAAPLYDRYLESAPDDPAALHNAGTLAAQRGDYASATARFERVLRINPAFAPALAILGLVHLRTGNAAKAEACLRKALAIDPRNLDAANNLAVVLDALGRSAEAIAPLEAALAGGSGDARALATLGELYFKASRYEQAVSTYAAAHAADPGYAPAASGHANAVAALGDVERGAALAHEATGRFPEHAPAWRVRAATELWQGRVAEAHRDYVRARDIAARDAGLASVDTFAGVERAWDDVLMTSQLGVAFTLLAQFDYASGWREWEKRWEGVLGPTRYPALPVWDGKPGDASVLFYAEQGLGDIVQFSRFLGAARERAGRIVVWLPHYWRSLASLLARMPGVDGIETGDAMPLRDAQGRPFDRRCSLLSLPYVCGLTADALPWASSYLEPLADRAAAWRERLAGLRGLRVGLSWRGNARRGQFDATLTDMRRSLSLDQLAPLARVPGVSWLGLQKDVQPGEIEGSPFAGRLADHSAGWKDFDDTLAFVDALDLVLTVDTAVAHLAAAAGKPVWLLNRFDSCWRWGLGRDDSPWYPSLRLFRQRRFGEWAHPVAAVAAQLEALAQR